jgi:hypothetical protein
MRVIATILMLSSLALAGCSEADPPVAEDEFQGAFDEPLVATSTTGVLRGVVVDNAVVPVSDVLITLLGKGINTTTNAAGAFGFSKLDPGTYFVVASKVGYNETQTSVEVVAGVANPPVLKILLNIAPGTAPYAVASQYAGFLACGFAVFATSIGCTINGNLGSATASVSIWRHEFDSAAIMWTQGELVWDQTQPAGGMLIWEITERSNDHIGYRETGESPALAYVNASVLETNNREIKTSGVDYRFFGGPHPSCRLPTPMERPAGAPVWYTFGCGATLDQSADAYVHDFYNFIPEEGWRFTTHGDPVVPV